MLEYVVRPFQQRNGAIVIPSTPSAPTEKAILTWGATSPLPIGKGVNFQVVCCKEQDDELSRQTEQVRIENPDDAEQYIMVARANSLKLNKKEHSTCGDNWDQFSGVGLEIDSALAEFSDAINSGTTAGNADPNQCGVTWNLKNNTSQG